MKVKDGITTFELVYGNDFNKLYHVTTNEGYDFILKGIMIKGEPMTIILDNFSVTPCLIRKYNIEDITLTDDEYCFMKGEVYYKQDRFTEDTRENLKKIRDYMSKEDYEHIYKYLESVGWLE